MGRPLSRAGFTRVVLAGSAALATAAAWLWLAGATPFAPHHSQPLGPSFLTAVIMWQAMIVAMMTPTVLPWVAAYAGLTSGPRRAASVSWPPVAGFAAGYFVVWLAYAVVGATLQLGVHWAGLVDHGSLIAPLAGAVLLGAGLSQFLPFKRACLTHCRNPISYLLARWTDGPLGGFRLGSMHGAYCVGCCWLVMLTGFAMGLMNLAWMAVLTLVLCVEQVAPQGERVGRLFGAGLAAWGLALFI